LYAAAAGAAINVATPSAKPFATLLKADAAPAQTSRGRLVEKIWPTTAFKSSADCASGEFGSRAGGVVASAPRVSSAGGGAAAMGRRRRASDAIAASVGPLLGRSTQRACVTSDLFDEGRAGLFFASIAWIIFVE